MLKHSRTQPSPTPLPHGDRGPSSALIVGGGIAGLGVALGLVRRGVEVTVVDRGAMGSGASNGNAGWVSPAQAGPLPAPGMLAYGLRSLIDPASALRIVPRTLPAMAPWLATFATRCRRTPHERGSLALAALGQRSFGMLDELGREGVLHTGTACELIVAGTGRDSVERALRQLAPLRRAGTAVPETILDGDELRRLEPALSPAVAAGFVLPEHRQVDPAALMDALADHLRDRGVRLLEGAAVTALAADSTGVSLRVGAATLRADVATLTAGAQTTGLAAHLGAPLPVVGGKGYSFDAVSAVPLRRPVLFCDAHVAVAALGDRIRVAGMMELPASSTVVATDRVDAMRAAARRGLVGWSDESLPWAGLRPLTPDGLPIVDCLAPASPRVFVATGYSMLGMTLGLPAGDALAEQICTGARPAVLQPFRASRPLGLFHGVARFPRQAEKRIACMAVR